MSDTNNTTKLVAFIVMILFVTGFVLMVGFASDDEPEDEINASIETLSTSSTDIEDHHTVDIQDDEVIVEGNIVGSNAGQTPVIENYSIEDDVLNIVIGLEDSDELAATVITGYEYRAEFEGVTTIDDVEITHSGSSDTTSGETDLETNIDLVSSSQSDLENRHGVDVKDNNSVLIEGNIVGSNAGQTPVIESWDVDSEGTLVVEIGLEQPDGMFGATVVTGYQYEAELNGISSFDNVEVVHTELDDQVSQKDVEVNLNNTGSSSQTQDRAEAQWEGDEVSVAGTIVGNTGGQHVVVSDSYEDDDAYIVELDTEIASDDDDVGVPMVVLGYNYELELSGLDSFDSIRVDHSEGGVYEFSRSESDEVGEGDNFRYRFINDGSSQESAELVEKDESTFTIEGSFVTGSSSCTEAGLSNIERSGSNIEVDLSSQSVDQNGEPTICTDDISSSPYTLEVGHDGDVDKVILNITHSHMHDDEEIEIEL